MKQRDFNRQMDAYLRQRRSEGGSLFDDLKRKLPKVKITSDEEPEQEVTPDKVPQDVVDAVMRGESVEPSVLEEVEQEVETGVVETSNGFRIFWQKVTDWFTPRPVVEEDLDDFDVAEEELPKKKANVDEDVKDMLRICVSWVNMLPPEKLQDIKRSDDFRKFKDLLDQYGLLKKK